MLPGSAVPVPLPKRGCCSSVINVIDVPPLRHLMWQQGTATVHRSAWQAQPFSTVAGSRAPTGSSHMHMGSHGDNDLAGLGLLYEQLPLAQAVSVIGPLRVARLLATHNQAHPVTARPLLFF